MDDWPWEREAPVYAGCTDRESPSSEDSVVVRDPRKRETLNNACILTASISRLQILRHAFRSTSFRPPFSTLCVRGLSMAEIDRDRLGETRRRAPRDPLRGDRSSHAGDALPVVIVDDRSQAGAPRISQSLVDATGSST